MGMEAIGEIVLRGLIFLIFLTTSVWEIVGLLSVFTVSIIVGLLSIFIISVRDNAGETLPIFLLPYT